MWVLRGYTSLFGLDLWVAFSGSDAGSAPQCLGSCQRWLRCCRALRGTATNSDDHSDDRSLEASKPRQRCRLKKTLSVANACRPTIALATLGVMLFFLLWPLKKSVVHFFVGGCIVVEGHYAQQAEEKNDVGIGGGSRENTGQSAVSGSFMRFHCAHV